MTYPREISGKDVSENLRGLVFQLAWHLIDGATADHDILKRQLAGAALQSVTLTGAGMYAHLEVPASAPTISVSRLNGGQVVIHCAQLDVSAGSLLGVENGRLAFVEVYTFGNRPWPDEPHVSALTDVMPIPIPDRAS